MTILRLPTLLAVLLLGACASPPPPVTRPQAPASPNLPQPAQAPAPPAALPAREPAAPPPPGPVIDSPQALQRAIATAVEHLEFGRDEAALAELQRVLQADAQHRLAQNLVRQIKEDPQSLLGRESFAYQVRPGESLSAIAGRFMRDVYLFYALARYNDIKVPRQLAGGQVIRVPGKAPPAGPSTGPAPVAAPVAAPAPPPPHAAAPASAPAPVSAPTPTPAPAPAPIPAPAPAPPPAPAPVEARQAQIDRLQRQARSAYAKQDLAGAIAAWNRLLAIDPDNRKAQLERQNAVELCKRLNVLTKDSKPAC